MLDLVLPHYLKYLEHLKQAWGDLGLNFEKIA